MIILCADEGLIQINTLNNQMRDREYYGEDLKIFIVA
jgi:hypothetical protein